MAQTDNTTPEVSNGNRQFQRLSLFFFEALVALPGLYLLLRECGLVSDSAAASMFGLTTIVVLFATLFGIVEWFKWRWESIWKLPSRAERCAALVALPLATLLIAATGDYFVTIVNSSFSDAFLARQIASGANPHFQIAAVVFALVAVGFQVAAQRKPQSNSNDPYVTDRLGLRCFAGSAGVAALLLVLVIARAASAG